MNIAENAQARRDLSGYVKGTISGGKETPDPKVLARLVNAAPAQQTLTSFEWWNVALLLAMEVEHTA